MFGSLWVTEWDADLLLDCVLWLLLWLSAALLIAAIFYLVYFLISLPLRRQERAQFFVDLLATGLRNGQSAEQTITGISSTRESIVGVRFHLLAAHIENGLDLARALEKVPRLLPRSIVATLKAGAEIGDYPKALAACREMLRDAPSQLRKAQNYVLLLAFGITPLGMFFLPWLCARVFPALEAVMADMGSGPPAAFAFVARYKWAYVVLNGLVLALTWASALFYLGGPRFLRWIEAGLPRFGDRVYVWIPWWRKRLQRDFSTVLAILLDAELPEERAVILASQCTDNVVFQKKAARVVEDLRNGTALPQAVRHLDDAGEFRWRLANASRGSGTFQAALAGWHESLDAKAFQLEQAATQTYTTLLVLFNGVVVGVITITVFQFLTQIISVNLLW